MRILSSVFCLLGRYPDTPLHLPNRLLELAVVVEQKSREILFFFRFVDFTFSSGSRILFRACVVFSNGIVEFCRALGGNLLLIRGGCRHSDTSFAHLSL